MNCRCRIRSIAMASAAAGLLSVNGCGVETAVIAAAGVSAGFGLAQGQAEAFISGELKAARMVPLEHAWGAVIAALDELAVPIRNTRRDEYDGFIRGKADGGAEISVGVKQKSPLITKIEIRVGIMGDQAVSRLVLSRIDAQLGILHPVIPPEQSPVMAPPSVTSQRDGQPGPTDLRSYIHTDAAEGGQSDY